LDKYTLDLIATEYRLKFNELVKKKGNPWKWLTEFYKTKINKL
jgi:hypothetical protein